MNEEKQVAILHAMLHAHSPRARWGSLSCVRVVLVVVPVFGCLPEGWKRHVVSRKISDRLLRRFSCFTGGGGR